MAVCSLDAALTKSSLTRLCRSLRLFSACCLAIDSSRSTAASWRSRSSLSRLTNHTAQHGGATQHKIQQVCQLQHSHSFLKTNRSSTVHQSTRNSAILVATQTHTRAAKFDFGKIANLRCWTWHRTPCTECERWPQPSGPAQRCSASSSLRLCQASCAAGLACWSARSLGTCLGCLQP
jgi:hypothetical protein